MADRLRQVLLEAFSNSGRPLRRIDRADVMIGIFAREGMARMELDRDPSTDDIAWESVAL